jgi:hypothetical protein
MLKNLNKHFYIQINCIIKKIILKQTNKQKKYNKKYNN